MRYGYHSRWLLLCLVLSLLPGDGIARRPNVIVGSKGTREETLKGVNLAARAAYGAARCGRMSSIAVALSSSGMATR